MTRRLRALTFVTAVILHASTLRAEATEDPRAAPTNVPMNGIALRPLSFVARGVAAEYERFIGPPRWSAAFGAAARAGSLGDYSSRTLDASSELRFWIDARRALGCTPGSMCGPYLSARWDVGLTTLSDSVESRTVGRSLTFAGTLAFGWRFVIARALAIGFSFGTTLLANIDPDGRLAPFARSTLSFGFDVGWLF